MKCFNGVIGKFPIKVFFYDLQSDKMSQDFFPTIQQRHKDPLLNVNDKKTSYYLFLFNNKEQGKTCFYKLFDWNSILRLQDSYMTQIVPVESARNYQKMKQLQKEWEDQYKVDRTFNEWLNANNTLKLVDSFLKSKEIHDPQGPTEEELE